MNALRTEINRKILAYEEAITLLEKHETVARSLLQYARCEMLKVLATVDREPLRKNAA